MQYPHVLTWHVYQAAPAYQDADGNWIQPEGTSETLSTPCRVEHPEQSGTNVVNTKHGEQHNFSFKVFLPKNTPDIQEGIEVVATDKISSATIGTGTVLQEFAGQLNKTLWAV
jgi:hypothetical protein